MPSHHGAMLLPPHRHTANGAPPARHLVAVGIDDGRRAAHQQRPAGAHVEADAVHEQIAARDLCGGLVAQDPSLSADLLFGVRAAILVDGLVEEELLGAWQAGRSALRLPAHAV